MVDGGLVLWNGSVSVVRGKLPLFGGGMQVTAISLALVEFWFLFPARAYGLCVIRALAHGTSSFRPRHLLGGADAQCLLYLGSSRGKIQYMPMPCRRNIEPALEC